MYPEESLKTCFVYFFFPRQNHAVVGRDDALFSEEISKASDGVLSIFNELLLGLVSDVL